MNEKAEKLLDAIIRLFLREGAKHITMDDIAENVRVSKVTLYKYFVDKDTLYWQVSRHILSGHIMALQEIVTTDAPLVAKFHDYLRVITAFIDSGRHALCSELATYSGDTEAEFALYSRACEHALSTLIDEGIAGGLVIDDLDRDMCFHYIDMGIRYYEQNEKYRYKMQIDDDFRQRFMSFLIGSIFTESAKNTIGPMR